MNRRWLKNVWQMDVFMKQGKKTKKDGLNVILSSYKWLLMNKIIIYKYYLYVDVSMMVDILWINDDMYGILIKFLVVLLVWLPKV